MPVASDRLRDSAGWRRPRTQSANSGGGSGGSSCVAGKSAVGGAAAADDTTGAGAEEPVHVALAAAISCWTARALSA